jgi:hypothetical protein
MVGRCSRPGLLVNPLPRFRRYPQPRVIHAISQDGLMRVPSLRKAGEH